jgi:pyridoxal phosphate enzyme (YggS family)
MSSMGDHLEQLEAAIEAACRAAGRNRAEIELMAVSKTHPAERIAEAAQFGLDLFGENRVQEFSAKAPGLSELRGRLHRPVRVHMIGHLQSNKAARAAELFDGIDSLDSLRLAERLNQAAGDRGKRLPVLLEIKLSTETAKTGLDPESRETRELLERFPDFGNLEMHGMMTVAPFGVGEDATRACFRTLRELRGRWAAVHPRLGFEVLSMGMSGDFALAIADGATRIRIGTAIFGARPPLPSAPAASELDG